MHRAFRSGWSLVKSFWSKYHAPLIFAVIGAVGVLDRRYTRRLEREALQDLEAHIVQWGEAINKEIDQETEAIIKQIDRVSEAARWPSNEVSKA